jgi:hypothetical protein
MHCLVVAKSVDFLFPCFEQLMEPTTTLLGLTCEEQEPSETGTISYCSSMLTWYSRIQCSLCILEYKLANCVQALQVVHSLKLGSFLQERSLLLNKHFLHFLSVESSLLNNVLIFGSRSLSTGV